MGKKGGYYAVQVGRETGVFSSWAECQAQVAGHSGAVYKKFDTPSAAQSFAASSGGYGGSYGGSNSSSSRGYSSSTYSNNSSYTKSYNNPYSSRASHSERFNYSGSSNSINPHSSVYATSGFSTTQRRSYNNGTGSPVQAPTPVKTSYYAVSNGRSKGIFNDWDSCKDQVNGFEGAKYKKFETLADAEAFIRENQPAAQESNYSPSSSFNSSGSAYNAPTPKATRSQTGAQKFYAANFSDGTSKIYDNWNDCQSAINGRRGVTFKKFEDYDSAVSFTKVGTPTQLTQAQRDASVSEYLRLNSEKTLKQQRDAEPKVVYTDGSYFPSGHAGLGVYFGPNDYRNVSAPVEGGAQDSYKPEVHALDKAMAQISKEIEEYKRGETNFMPKYVISADNEAAKNVLTKYADHWTKEDFLKRNEGETLYRMAQNYKHIKNFYHDNAEVFGDHNFDVKWVKGHSGVDGNEMADQLAKSGAMSRNH